MADSRNQPELETLDYKPKCESVTVKSNEGIPVTVHLPKQAVNAPPATLGFNSVVIKPETRVNKAEDQPLQESKMSLEEAEATAQEYFKTSEQPNLKIILEIEWLISQVDENLYKLDKQAIGSMKLKVLVRKALEEIDLFQKTTSFELRKAFE